MGARSAALCLLKAGLLTLRRDTETVLDVDAALLQHHVQVLYQALLTPLCLSYSAGKLCFYDLLNSSQQFIWAFQEVFLCAPFASFLVILCCSLYHHNIEEAKCRTYCLFIFESLVKLSTHMLVSETGSQRSSLQTKHMAGSKQATVRA